MLVAAGQFIGSKMVTAIFVVAGAGAVIWFWKHPEHLETIWLTIKYVLAWMGCVLALPWATFFVTRWVISKDSNAAAGAMLAGYSLIDFIVAWWLIGSLSGIGSLSWAVLLLGILSAAVYNLKVCEHIAEQVENGI